MSHALLRRRLPALLTAASLALLPAVAQARPLRSSTASREHRAALSLPQQAAAVFGTLWHALTNQWGKSGMSIDPNGAPAPTQPNSSGSSIDPNGRPGDSGSSIDPNG